MENSKKIIALFLYLFALYAIGSLVFTKGFLLKRVVVENNSVCDADFAQYSDGMMHGAKGCWLHRRFDKAVIVVVDALRFDFMAVTNATENNHLPYLNKLPIIQTLAENKPMNARLYKFIADPPTTTLQRLKGLTTGSLPTFVDAGSNFGSSEISEDNFIDQLGKNGKKITFLGDDTWISIFPNRFNRAHHFPSFNVKDLHTVDNGILDHLYTELRRPDWDVLIAHFLGVDHCGHRYGPNHPAMADKLAQMNDVIRNVTQRLDKETILFVLGDHGMTPTGDHGGDSMEELTAGLFVYSTQQITSTPYTKGEYKTISQIDLVPTISLLLGLPIPFSNLGQVMTDLLNYCSWTANSHIKQVYHTVEALRLNALQMSQYIDKYVTLSSDFSAHKLYVLQEQLRFTETQLSKLVTEMFVRGRADEPHERLHTMETQYLKYISEIKSMCKDVWAKFDLTLIALGVTILISNLLINVYYIFLCDSFEEKGFGSGIIVCVSSAIFTVYAVIQTLFLQGGIVGFMAFLLGIINIVTICCVIQAIRPTSKEEHSSKTKWKLSINISFESLLAYSAIIVAIVSFFSNSFVVYEASIAAFWVHSLIWILCARTIQQMLRDKPLKDHSHTTRRNKSFTFDIMKVLSQPVALVLYITFACSACVKLSSNFRVCREEQVNCTLSYFLHPLSSIGETVEGSKNVRYFTSAVCLLLSTYLIRQWMKHFGNLNGSALPVMCARYLLPASSVCCILHWAVQGLPERILDSFPAWQQTILAQAVYILFLISVTSIIITPLCVYALPRQHDEISMAGGVEKKDLIQKIYNHLKLNWQNNASREASSSEKAPVVYGLGTTFTAAIVYVLLAWLQLLALLLGDGLAPSLLTAILAVFFFLELFTVASRFSSSDLTTTGIVILSLMSTNYFYAMGHHATIPAIRFEAAFIGFHGDWEYKALPATLIYLNEFAAEVLFTIITPLLIVWPFTKGVLAPFVQKRGEQTHNWKGDFVLFENPREFSRMLMRLISMAFLISGLKLFGAVCAACLHRRHLMVWKIFAPRFVYQALSSFTVFAACILVVLLLTRVSHAVGQWVKNLHGNPQPS